MNRYAPNYSTTLPLYCYLSDQMRIRLEAVIRISVESFNRSYARMIGYPIPPTVEEMRFDGDRGL